MTSLNWLLMIGSAAAASKRSKPPTLHYRVSGKSPNTDQHFCPLIHHLMLHIVLGVTHSLGGGVTCIINLGLCLWTLTMRRKNPLTSHEPLLKVSAIPMWLLWTFSIFRNAKTKVYLDLWENNHFLKQHDELHPHTLWCTVCVNLFSVHTYESVWHWHGHIGLMVVLLVSFARVGNSTKNTCVVG